MRHWRSALDQIYEHYATRSSSAYTLQTDTERALQDALGQLELQCKERIDLLQALYISRQESPLPSPNPRIDVGYGGQTSNSYEGSSLGQGTVPAVSYSDLSRPALPPRRPELPDRTSTEGATVGGSRMASSSSMGSYAPPIVTIDDDATSARTLSPNALRLPSRHGKTDRSASPEKRTMRTTLRSGRLGEKHGKPSRKVVQPAAEGPSKAATKAWSARGARDKFLGAAASPEPPSTVPSPRQSSEQPRKPSSHLHWDSASRRLVTPYDKDPANVGFPAPATRHSEEYPSGRPSLLSVSAASSALGLSTITDSSPNEAAGVSSPLQPRKQTSLRDMAHKSTTDDSEGVREKLHPAGLPLRRKPADRESTSFSPVRKEKPNRSRRREVPKASRQTNMTSSEDDIKSSATKVSRGKRKEQPIIADENNDKCSSQESDEEGSPEDAAWKKKKQAILKNLPAGVDESAAKQVLNDVIIQGDEVRWSDIAGLETAKNALREIVVYPFLRPDLFMGLREPARGMMLFGPPGTGKTMLARAVATESRSTFFSISASSLTSKFLGESEKLVRALFGLARALAPSIIFVDEIDSLLSQRSGSGEHEATRRIKTEFLIQWSDLQRAAAGREASEKDKERGDANRVLVLAATNLPWAIDEAARRRFVRRQYIPLPEAETRATQLRTLLGQQKHGLSEDDIEGLILLTEGKTSRIRSRMADSARY